MITDDKPLCVILGRKEGPKEDTDGGQGTATEILSQYRPAAKVGGRLQTGLTPEVQVLREYVLLCHY